MTPRGMLRAWRGNAAKRGGNDGFTLIEVLVAFAVLAVFMVTIQSGAIGALGGLSRAQSQIEAEMALRTLMSGPLGADPLATPQTNGTMGRLSWTITLEPLPAGIADRPSTSPDTGTTWVPVLMTIAVSTPGDRRPLASVETVRLVQAGAAP